MIRMILAASLMLLLIFVLYLPSANPPERLSSPRCSARSRSLPGYFSAGRLQIFTGGDDVYPNRRSFCENVPRSTKAGINQNIDEQ
jgi:hypothetical protein